MVSFRAKVKRIPAEIRAVNSDRRSFVTARIHKDTVLFMRVREKTAERPVHGLGKDLLHVLNVQAGAVLLPSSVPHGSGGITVSAFDVPSEVRRNAPRVKPLGLQGF